VKKLSKESAKLKNSIQKDYGIYDDHGIAILQAGMEAKDQMEKAMAQVDIEGLTVGGDRGGIKAHPLLSVIRDSRSQFLMALKHLNLDLEPLRDKAGRPPGGS
jgi:hypothetical protein